MYLTQRLPSRLLLVFAFIFALFVCNASVQAISCATPCFPDFPTCQISFCDENNGVCVDTPRDPLPSGCCVSSSQCRIVDPCVVGSCDFLKNECIYTNVCAQSQSDFENGETCMRDKDCDDDDPCSSEKCIDGFCVTSPNPDTRDPNCCQVSSDCPRAVCKTAYCSAESFRCFYQTDFSCSIYEVSTGVYETILSSGADSPDSPSVEQESPGVGDIIGAVIGFVILGVLVVAFIIVVLLMIIQKIIKKITSDG